MNSTVAISHSQLDTTRAFVIAWICSLAFYFLEYAARSAPAVMVPDLARAFNVTELGVSGILGTYYYTYSSASLLAGVLLDRYGAKFIVPGGMLILGLGCLLFVIPDASMGYLGRLLMGAGSAFAFTGAVYLASRGFPAQRLATAIGATQCLGMLGGTAGQIVVGHWMRMGMSITIFWTGIGIAVLVVGAALLTITPRRDVRDANNSGSVFATYKVVFSNPQSYLCGLAAGLLFVPTTVGDMVWGVRFFQNDRSFSFDEAVFVISMVPLGWVFGCPLIGWLADRIGRRKPAYIGGATIMLAGFGQLLYLPGVFPVWTTLLVIGIASGAAMIPYTIIKEVNPDEVKGSATGAINFLTFGVTALIGPLFATLYGKTLGSQTIDHAAHFQQAGLFWIFLLVVAIFVGLILKETGKGYANVTDSLRTTQR